MSGDRWATFDRELFAAVLGLQSTPATDPFFGACKDRFGRLFVRKLGGWLAVRFGRSLRAAGLELEELLHEVYLRVHRRLFSEEGIRELEFEGPRKLRNYLFTVARKTAVDVLAGRGESVTPEPRRPAGSTPDLAWMWKYLPFLDPEARTSAPATFEGTGFSADEQRALYFWYVDACPHRLIAERLGATPGGAKQLVYRAKVKLLQQMPGYAARECLMLLSAFVPAGLCPRSPPDADEARAGAVRRLAGIIRLGLEQDRAASFRARAASVLGDKIGDALSSTGDRPRLGALREALAEMLLYLTRAALQEFSAEGRAGAAGGRPEGAERFALLFFSLCTLLPERPELPGEVLERARRILGRAWPAPPVPRPEWYGEAAQTVTELDHGLVGSRPAAGHAGARADLESVSPEECLLQAFICEADAEAARRVREELPAGPVADWLRGFASTQ